MQRAHIEVTAVPEAAGDFFRNGHRAMVPTGTTDAHGDEVLPLMAVAGEHRVKHGDKPLDKGLSRLLRQDIIRNRLVGATVPPQLRYPIGIGKKANINDKVRITR